MSYFLISGPVLFASKISCRSLGVSNAIKEASLGFFFELNEHYYYWRKHGSTLFHLRYIAAPLQIDTEKKLNGYFL